MSPESSVGQVIIRVLRDCLSEKLYRHIQGFARSLVPVASALEVEVIGPYVFGVSLDQLSLLLARQPEFQLLRNFLRNLSLQFKNVGGLTLVLLAPDL